MVTFSNSKKWTIINFYKDGVLVDIKNTAHTPSPLSGTVFLGSGSPSSSFFMGTMDDVKIYNRALTTVEISDDYNGIVPVVTATPVPVVTTPIPTPTQHLRL